MELKSYLYDSFKIIYQECIYSERVYFSEYFRCYLFSRHFEECHFVQENESLSLKNGQVRVLHFQTEPNAQGKLVRCTAGALFDIAVDLRAWSPTYGRWVGETLTPYNGRKFWVPPGFTHGFSTLEPDTVTCNKLTDYYGPECDRGLAGDDPAIGIFWPVVADADTLSAKDRKQPLLADLPAYFSWSN
ncbi:MULTISPECIES: dTDP-4-dehydrorhamnose 3,5-epimerase [Sphingobium]|uniref:dTDP-4-dehydrorhamnose 3,5-epimerase n=1 Tax=Sphingobium TaxID=165695 RepID=UPI003A5C16D7